MTTEKQNTPPIEDLPYEVAAARLEEIVRMLEGDTLPLEQGLALYEEGVALIRRCTRVLNHARQRVQVLHRTPDGEIGTADFTDPEAE